ncbi:unnamed protein product [Linum trigynum]|uniref:Uncharacterized protein n=1 Tax=Linum trigynum TaxID=586398 RepID=A0AAV2FZN8_9ROSI
MSAIHSSYMPSECKVSDAVRCRISDAVRCRISDVVRTQASDRGFWSNGASTFSLPFLLLFSVCAGFGLGNKEDDDDGERRVDAKDRKR